VDALARVCERIAATNSRNRKIELLAGYFRSLNDADVDRAARIVMSEPVPGTTLSVGGSLLRDAAVEASGWPLDLVRLCMREVGDTGETIGLLMHGRTHGDALTLAEAEARYQRLAMARRTSLKLAVLVETFGRFRPLALKYFVKGITGSWRMGLQTKMVREALEASGRAAPALATALFRPIDFMLARASAPGELTGEWWVEDKYDGIRSQAHVRKGEVRIFTRGLDDTTAAFPEIVEALAGLPGEAILDGEVLAWRDDRALPFTVLQQRLARKKVAAEMIERVPVIFLAYDLLWRDGESLLGRSYEERRTILESMPVRVGPRERIASLDELDTRFLAARARGNEGLMLKRADSAYEAGRRGDAWAKVKRPYATLDVVVTAAEQGHGRRATVLSDYTFAVRDGDRFLNVGKAYSGLTDEEIRELTRIFRGIATERFGRVTLVKPEVVLEVAFDGIQASPRHKSGFALRFPRILHWRRDKKAVDIDSIATVRELYEAQFPTPSRT
jgi:DNA ligase-1